MAITVVQIPGAISTVSALGNQLISLGALLRQAQSLSSSGWIINIGDGANPINVTVSPSQQQALVALYDALKASLVTTFQQLP